MMDRKIEVLPLHNSTFTDFLKKRPDLTLFSPNDQYGYNCLSFARTIHGTWTEENEKKRDLLLKSQSVPLPEDTIPPLGTVVELYKNDEPCHTMISMFPDEMRCCISKFGYGRGSMFVCSVQQGIEFYKADEARELLRLY